MRKTSIDRREMLAGLGAFGASAMLRAETSPRSIVPASHGLVGELHLPPGRKKAPGLLVLGGPEGGHATAYRYAELLAAHGFARPEMR